MSVNDERISLFSYYFNIIYILEVLTSNIQPIPISMGICLNNYDQIRNYTIIKLESVLVYGPENFS
jgi:hypothetical protein